MGDCLVKKHLFKLQNFGVITPVQIASGNASTHSFSFTGTTSNALYVFCCGVDTASATPPTLSSCTVSSGINNKVLYTSPSTYAACGVVRLDAGGSCSVSLSISSYYLVVKIPVENADVEVVDQQFITGSTSGTAAPSVTDGALGALYIGAGCGGKHNGSISAVYTKTNCDGNNITYQDGWNIHNVGIFIPTSTSNSFQCGASFYDAQGAYQKYVAGYMFKVYRNIWFGGNICN